MDKKTITIIIIVVAVLVVVGGLYYGVNRWRQQQLANQILKQVYGVNSTGILGGLIGGGGTIQQQIANELAKDEAQQKADEVKEAAKTPQDKYNETKETAIAGAVSPVLTNEIEPAIKAIFGQAKITSYGTGYLSGQSGSFGANFKVPRVITAEDLNKLSSEFQNKGYTVIANSTESDSGEVTLAKGEESSLTISYSGDDQVLEILYWQLSAQ